MEVSLIILVAFIASQGLAAEADKKDRIVDPEELRQFKPRQPLHVNDNWTNWESWEVSTEILTLFPYYRSGYDEDGLFVYVLEYGKWNFRTLIHMPEEKLQEFWRYYEQLARRAERDSTMSSDQGKVFLVDWDGFNLNSYSTGPALQALLQTFTFFVKFNQALKYGMWFNVNFSAETFINTAESFIGGMLEKIETFDTRSDKWKPHFLGKIPASQLPVQYGGYKSWKPLPFKQG